MNSTYIGDNFRDNIFKIVQAMNPNSATTEKMVGGKKADIYYEEYDRYNTIRKIAIECKNYKSALGNSDISRILSDYHAAFLSSEIDLLLIISEKGLSAQGHESINAGTIYKVKHLTRQQFIAQTMNFNRYQLDITLSIKNDSLVDYYIPAKTNNESTIDIINHWIESDTKEPIAILAGYGMGKSSLATYIAHNLIETRGRISNERIPILIRLGQLSSEQSLDGLISKHLTSDHKVDGYSFSLFRELNRNGLFVIILDGFDEMKFAMTYSAFKYNLDQIGKLIEGNSKVIILGRPNAFMSEDEKNSVLNCQKILSSQTLKTTSIKNYKELTLDEFTNSDIRIFFRKYLKSKSQLTESEIEARILEIEESKISSILHRPVHSKMLAEILISSSKGILANSRYDLYKTFSGLIFSRDFEKTVRQSIPPEQREEIIGLLAWHLWKQGGKSSFSKDDIPSYIIKRLQEQFGIQKDQATREVLIGGLIESKGSDGFYFSHRSFQEFLVAKYLTTEQSESEEIETLSNTITPEICSFIEESPLRDEFANRLFFNLKEYKGELTLQLVNIVAKYYSFDANNKPNSTWQHLIFIIKSYSDTNKAPHEIAFDLTKISKESNNFKFAIAFELAKMESTYTTTPVISRDIIRHLAGLLLINCSPIIREYNNIQGNVRKIALHEPEPNQFLAAISNSIERAGEGIIKINSQKLLDDTITSLSSELKIPNLRVTSIHETLSFTLTQLFEPFKNFQNHDSVIKEYRRYFSNKSILPKVTLVERGSVQPKRKQLKLRTMKKYLD